MQNIILKKPYKELLKMNKRWVVTEIKKGKREAGDRSIGDTVWPVHSLCCPIIKANWHGQTYNNPREFIRRACQLDRSVSSPGGPWQSQPSFCWRTNSILCVERLEWSCGQWEPTRIPQKKTCSCVSTPTNWFLKTVFTFWKADIFQKGMPWWHMWNEACFKALESIF